MQMPPILPKKLESYKSISEEKDIFDLLKQNPADMILFFESACNEEVWIDQNFSFLKKIIEWFTYELFLDRLDLDIAKRASQCIHQHYSELNTLIPLNLKLKTESKVINISSFLFGAASNFFQNLIRQECRDKKSDVLFLKGTSKETFPAVIEFINTGKVQGLWRNEPSEILEILRQAARWDIFELMTICQETYMRYLNKSNGLDFLKMSLEENWGILKCESIKLINKVNNDFRIHDVNVKYIGYEFFEYSVNALGNYNYLKNYITHLFFSRSLTEAQEFIHVVKHCPHLLSVDLTLSNSFNDNLFEMPSNLQELNLSSCSWLNSMALKKLFLMYPKIKSLYLRKNTSITFQGWSELQKLYALKFLDLSFCNQITDEDFKMILQACRGVLDLLLEDCKKISDNGFLEIPKLVPRLVYLSLARCNISDRVLIEIAVRCKELKSLTITRCLNITDKGVKEIVKNVTSLRELNLSNCQISHETIMNLKKRNPFLNVIN